MIYFYCQIKLPRTLQFFPNKEITHEIPSSWCWITNAQSHIIFQHNLLPTARWCLAMAGHGFSSVGSSDVNICVSKHLFRSWLVACSLPGHRQKQCLFIIKWIFGSKFRWNLNQNIIIFISQNTFEKCRLRNGHFFSLQYVEELHDVAHVTPLSMGKNSLSHR